MSKRKGESKEEFNERTRERRREQMRRYRQVHPGYVERQKIKDKGARKTIILHLEYEEGAQLSTIIRISRKGKILPCEFKLRTQIESLKRAHRARGLGFNPISQEHEGCEWHHVNDIDVVQTPIHIHRIGSRIEREKTEGVLG